MQLILKSFLVLFTILSLSCGDSKNPMPPDDGGDPTPELGQWVTLAPLPTPRQEMPHAMLNNRIYVAGGFAQNRTGSTLIEIYDPETDTWSVGVPLPAALHHFGLVAAKNTLYIIGGYQGNGFSATSQVYELNAQNDEWMRRRDMPTRRGAHAAVEVGGKIYAIGGADIFGQALNTIEEYNPDTDTWVALEPMHTAREHLAAAVVDSVIYVVGGRSNDSGALTNKNELEAYSLTRGEWSSLADMPTARGGLAAAGHAGRLFVFGGEFPGIFSQNQEYDPESNLWRDLAAMPTPRHGMGAVALENRIYIIGGGPVAGFGVTSTNEAFIPPSR